MGLTKIAIARPVFILMLMLAAFGIGTISYRSMRLEQNPDINLGTITVTTVYAGAGPEEINNLISRKIEEAVSGVAGIREVTSTSLEGESIVVVTLVIGADTDVALSDVRSKIDSITNDLPKDALKPEVSKLDINGQPILDLSFSSTTLNSRDLRTLIDDRLKDRFAEIPGVASADVNGGDIREIQVQVNKDKLMSYGVGILDVRNALAAATLNAPSGHLISGPRDYSVRMLGEFKSADDIRNMVFTINDPQNPIAKPATVHLSDVATVLDTSQERSSYARVNGRDSIVIDLQKTKEGNAVDITKAADGVIAQLTHEYEPIGLQIVKTTETAKDIVDSLNDLNFALYFGVFLVATIVYIFLHNFRGTLIVALAIPTSIFASFIGMKALGFTINQMSMLALSLAIGVLVDDAIVVLENINRHLRLGEDPKDAAINGRAEIGLAAIAITMADVVVFLPVGSMGGIVGQFFKPMALGFVCAVLFSLFVSFTLTPMLASRWYRAGDDMEHVTGWFATRFEKRFHRLERWYARTLEWCLNHRWFVFTMGNIALLAVFMGIAGGSAKSIPDAAISKPVVTLLALSTIVGFILFLGNSLAKRRFLPKYILFGLLFGLIFPASAVVGKVYQNWKQDSLFKFSFFPESDAGQVNIAIEMPPGTSLDTTGKVVERIENIVKQNPDTKNVLSYVGTQVGGFASVGNTGSNYAQITVQLQDKISAMDQIEGKHSAGLRTRSGTSDAAAMTVAIGHIPGASIKVSSQSGIGIGSPIQMSFTSDDRQLLIQTTSHIRQLLEQGAVPGVINPDVSSKPGKPEIQMVPDRLALADAGLSVTDAGSALRTLYQGDDDTKLRVNGREYAIRVMLSLNDRDNPNIITELPVTFKRGNPIMLGSVANLQIQPAIDKINRRDRIEEISLTADLLPGLAAGTMQQSIDDWMTKEHLIPAGVKEAPLGEAQFQAQEMPNIFLAFGVGLVLVYMLLASLFDNLLYPLIIQVSQPQAMVGAILALVLTDQSLNLVGFIGLICLVGLVGKNAILLVDYTNTLRTRGQNRHDALVAAGPTRLRPILMTTCALILSMLPVALALGRGSEFRETIGITIIGGISLSTLLTLLVIPCSYTIFDDFSRWIGRLSRRLRGVKDAGDQPFKVSAGS
jgi:HAE1 family hydrophobic/amphiphilic exporter-1